MQFRVFKLRFRRRFRKSQHQVEDLGHQAELSLERHFFKRLGSLGQAWRFISTWVILFLLLIGCATVQLSTLGAHYQRAQPIAGGTYTEGILGTFTNANPIFATSDVDTTVSNLVFAGLFKLDSSSNLVGSLARTWETDAKGTVYTVHLKPNLHWHDGKPLTADDVVFTYHAIQNPDAKSPLFASWQGITVTKKDAYTVVFTLANPLASFPYSLTTGIIPDTAFGTLPPGEWRSADFNTMRPVGAGPFQWHVLQVQSAGKGSHISIALNGFGGYQGGKPKLDDFVVDAYSDRDQLLAAAHANKLTAIAGIDKSPGDDLEEHDFILNAATMAFLNTENGVTADPQVRRALLLATDRQTILRHLGYPTRAVREPLLQGQLAYNASFMQSNFDLAQAAATLDSAGWVAGKDGIRTKDGKPLQLTLVASDNGEYAGVAPLLARQWRAAGVKVALQLDDAQTLQSTLASHAYNAVLYGITIGKDPDVFVYWDSSQSDPRSSRLNLSLYKSAAVDSALEAGRTRLDPTLRTVKYRPFLQAWQQDTPAIGLYQPRYLYLTHGDVYGLDVTNLTEPTDRFANVENWMIRTTKATVN